MIARTKDEKFIIALYEASLEMEDMESEHDKYIVGKRAHLQPKGVETICVLLAQANFIKNGEGSLIRLTPHGLKLIDKLLEE